MCDPNFKRIEKPNAATSLFTKNQDNKDQVFLQTAKAHILSTNVTGSAFIRLIMDGGSQLTYIKQNVSRKLGLKILGTRKLSVMTFGCEERSLPKQYNKVELKLKSQYNEQTITITAIEVPEICLDSFQTPNMDFPILKTLNLADVSCKNVTTSFDGISLLIGADNYWKIVTGELIRLTTDLSAINTVFGWTLQGPNVTETTSTNANVISALHVHIVDEQDFTTTADLKQFWELETIGINDKASQISFTEEFIENNIYLKEDRFEVCLPWKIDCEIDSNYDGALSRVKNLTTRLLKNNRLIEYDKAVREFVDNDIAEKAPAQTSSKKYYMPHRPVYREDKTTSKIRCVFDASSHAPNFPSLNELLYSGENLIQDLMKVLLNFRVGKIAITADIEKAFLQIKLCERDRDCHRFLWYKEPIYDLNNLPPMEEYRMTRVTFGVTSSPFLLSATLKKHFENESSNFPETTKHLINSFYVDDLVVTVNSYEEAVKLYDESKFMLNKASINLRKWQSNDKNFRDYYKLKEKDINMNKQPCSKVLGLCWDSANDNLSFDLNGIIDFVQKTKVFTKRSMLQTIGRIYDPLCVLGPFTVKAKILLQKLWKLKIEWDSELPEEVRASWRKWCDDLTKLNSFTISRNVLFRSDSRYELHVFSDASKTAYGTVAYIRELINDQVVNVKILIAKNRFAPIKADSSEQLTLPRLELTAALCSSRLQDYILKNLNLKFESVNLWCDSKITLYWILGNSNKWKTYVHNRVNTIQKLTKNCVWRHCAGKMNPADLLTRGVSANELLASTIWINGPSFLWQTNDKEWTICDSFENSFVCVTSSADNSFSADFIFDFERYEHFDKCLRVTAYVQRIFNKNKSSSLSLSLEEIQDAEMYWIRKFQEIAYRSEIKDLQSKNIVNKTSSIYDLTPFVDDNGILRIKSRLQEIDLPYDTVNPIILPKNCAFVKKIIWKTHNKCFHSGVNLTLAELRKKYWIVRGRQTTKSVISKCVVCKKLRGKPGNEVFAPLPKSRINATRAFENTGIDFAGPLYVLSETNEKRKSYLMLLTCAVTRAVHLELVLDLSTENCIRGLRRFISRRGIPQNFYSDNAKTFKRTSTEITKLYELLATKEIAEFSSKQRIKWNFIVERAAWWGGFWERLIKTAKDCLKFALGKLLVTTEELQTILCEVEAIINSRPLTYIDDDPTNLTILSPSNFLLGNNADSSLPDAKFCMTRDRIIQQWKERQRILNKFWKKWASDYLLQLRNAHLNNWSPRSSNFETDNIVLLHDQGAPRLSWKMVRINKVFPGRDGKIRACEIQLPNGTLLRRPIQLLYPLEIPIAGPEDVENISEKPHSTRVGSVSERQSVSKQQRERRRFTIGN